MRWAVGWREADGAEDVGECFEGNRERWDRIRRSEQRVCLESDSSLVDVDSEERTHFNYMFSYVGRVFQSSFQ